MDRKIPVGSALENYYKKSNEDYDTVGNTYSEEAHYEDGSLVLGEEALFEKISLAEGVGQKRTVVELCEEFLERFPDSTKNLQKCYDKSKLASSTINTVSVVIGNQVREFSLEGITEPTFPEYGVEILIGYPEGVIESRELRHNQRVYLREDSSEFIQLGDIGPNYAKCFINTKSKGTLENIRGAVKSLEKRLEKDVLIVSNDYTFTLKKVNLKNVASVTIEPRIDYKESKATIIFNIGIEKRKDIFGLLAPKKIREKLESLEKSIKKRENINTNLENVVSYGKTA